MEQQPKKRKEKNSIAKGLRMQVLAWAMIVGILMLFGGTFAWYSIKAREAESKPAEVMKPYYLVLLNPSETDVLQLSVGSLMPGRTKQVVFCVSNKNNEEKQSEAKRILIERIKKHCKQDLEHTNYNKKLNLFFIELR